MCLIFSLILYLGCYMPTNDFITHMQNKKIGKKRLKLPVQFLLLLTPGFGPNFCPSTSRVCSSSKMSLFYNSSFISDRPLEKTSPLSITRYPKP